jgi:hypothetical protein
MIKLQTRNTTESIEQKVWKSYFAQHVRIHRNNAGENQDQDVDRNDYAMVEVRLPSLSERRTFWAPINGVKIPKDFESRGRIAEPYLKELARWMAYWGIKLVNGGVRLEEAAPLGIKDILVCPNTTEIHGRSEYRGPISGRKEVYE